MTEYTKPLPLIDQDTKPFWDSCQQHAMAVQRCLDCKSYRFPPRITCPKCLSTNSEWVQVRGKGQVLSFVTYYQTYGPAWQGDSPYNVSIVELEEGVRLFTNMVDCPPSEVRVGMPVEVVYEDVTEEIALPKFRPIRN